MNLGRDIAGALPALRAQAESRMTDTVRITRPGAPVFDTTTGTYTQTDTVVYSGPARLKLSSTVVSSIEAGGQILAGQSPRLDLPVSTSGGVQVDDSVVVTASVNDPASVGLRLNIEGVFFQTDATARRFPVEVQS
jgi:hypothetical protein